MRQRSAIALLMALAGMTPTLAAGPYQVFRVTAPASLTPGSPMATVLSAGTVSDGTLEDGVSYFYFVRDAQGATLDVSASANRALGTVELTFDGTGTLREDALGTLQELFGPAGVLATLAAAAPGTDVADELLDANGDGMNALDDLAFSVPEFDDSALRTWLDFALRALARAKSDPAPYTASEIAALEERILEAARALVTYRFELAVGHCGACDSQSGSPAMVCEAQRRLDQGNTLRATTGTPSQIVDAYGACIHFSVNAMSDCD
jgi:hypothetical protein